jgi:hypothetical protein
MEQRKVCRGNGVYRSSSALDGVSGHIDVLAWFLQISRIARKGDALGHKPAQPAIFETVAPKYKGGC